MIRQSLSTIGVRKDSGQPRIWIEGKYLEKAGFVKGSTISITWKDSEIIIRRNGNRKVCGKKFPLIDINNKKILEIFSISEKVHIIVNMGEIFIRKSFQYLRKLLQISDGSVGHIFAGIGLIDQALVGTRFKTKWAIEKNKDFADIWQDNHHGKMYQGCVSEFDYSKLEQVELLITGIPCENWSIAKKNLSPSETMDLALFVMMIIERVNPKTVLIEEVPGFLKSQIGIAVIQALERMGYDVTTKIISGVKYGELTKRKRAVVIASSEKQSFPDEFEEIHYAKEILLSPDDPECKWFSLEDKKWLKDHWDKQKAKGNSFYSQIITEDSTSIQGIGAKHFEYRGSDPYVKHPTKELYRTFTITEAKKIMGLPEDYKLDKAKYIIGRGIFQGVLVNVFRRIIGELV